MVSSVAYPVGVAKLDLRQPVFTENSKSWEAVLEKFNDSLEKVSSEGTDASQELHQSRGQLLGEFILG